MDDVVAEAETLLRPINTNTDSASVAEETEEKIEVQPKEGEEEKKEGLLDQISSSVSPRAGAGNQAQGFGETQQVGNGTEETGEAAAERGGGSNFIHNLVSHLHHSLPDDAAPTTDEAYILIHSIVHD